MCVSSMRKEHIVLNYEHDIKRNGDKAEAKLCNIPCDSRPITKIGTVEYKLQVAQHAARKVKQNVPYGPTIR